MEVGRGSAVGVGTAVEVGDAPEQATETRLATANKARPNFVIPNKNMVNVSNRPTVIGQKRRVDLDKVLYDWAPSVDGRGGQVRTADLLVPNQARYRCATPRRLSTDWLMGGTPGETRTPASGFGGQRSIR